VVGKILERNFEGINYKNETKIGYFTSIKIFLPYHFTFSPIKCKKKKKYGLLETGQFGWM
jgi:hypothetical protein